MRLFEGTQFDLPPKCDRCGALESDCNCPPPEVQRTPPSKQTARLAIEKRRKGKQVTVVRDLDVVDLPDLLTILKNVCGAGGTIKDNAIEVQGKHLDRIRQTLEEIGYRIRI